MAEYIVAEKDRWLADSLSHLLNAGKYKQALALLESEMEKSNPKAFFALGTWFFFGENGCKKDEEKGLEYIRKAAELKDSDALYHLALYYERLENATDEDVKKAFLYYFEAALLGDASAMYEVGRCLFYGIGTTQNELLAEVAIATAEHLGYEEQDDDR